MGENNYGNSQTQINIDKLAIKFGDINIIHKGKLDKTYKESDVASYMKNLDIEINISAGSGKKNFTAYTMDLTKKYIEINADYRT